MISMPSSVSQGWKNRMVLYSFPTRSMLLGQRWIDPGTVSQDSRMDVGGLERRAAEPPTFDAKFSSAMRMALPRITGPSDTRNAPVRGVSLVVASFLGLTFVITGYLVLSASRHGNSAIQASHQRDAFVVETWLESVRHSEAFRKAERIGGVGFSAASGQTSESNSPGEVAWMVQVNHAIRAASKSQESCDMFKVGVLPAGKSFNVGRECPDECVVVAWGAAAKWRVRNKDKDSKGEFFVDQEQAPQDIFVIPLNSEMGGIVSASGNEQLNLYLCARHTIHRGLRLEGDKASSRYHEGR